MRVKKRKKKKKKCELYNTQWSEISKLFQQQYKQTLAQEATRTYDLNNLELLQLNEEEKSTREENNHPNTKKTIYIFLPKYNYFVKAS